VGRMDTIKKITRRMKIFMSSSELAATVKGVRWLGGGGGLFYSSLLFSPSDQLLSRLLS
jgi:hypothetical protein